MPESIIYKLLSDVALNVLEFAEAGTKASEYKAMERTKAKLCKMLDVDTWQKAKEKYPQQAKEERLQSFVKFFTGMY